MDATPQVIVTAVTSIPENSPFNPSPWKRACEMPSRQNRPCVPRYTKRHRFEWDAPHYFPAHPLPGNPGPASLRSVGQRPARSSPDRIRGRPRFRCAGLSFLGARPGSHRMPIAAGAAARPGSGRARNAILHTASTHGLRHSTRGTLFPPSPVRQDMNATVAVLMDPIDTIHPEKDTTLALLLEAQRRGHPLRYMRQGDMAVRDGVAWACLAPLAVRDRSSDWFELGEARWQPLAKAAGIVLARKDPPFDTQFLYDTLVLDLAVRAGVRVINDPQALRDFNEKLAAQWFPQCCAPALVARERGELRRFAHAHGEIVVKPLDGMGGRGIFRTRGDDPNLNSILETLAGDDHRFVMAQKFIPEIRKGDKRILMVNGEPVPYALARIPQGTDFRGNLAAGGRGVGQPLTERDRWIAAEVGPELARRGIVFAGLDVIGDFLTEVNVTSPTCARELDAQFGLNIAGMVFDAIEAGPDPEFQSGPPA